MRFWIRLICQRKDRVGVRMIDEAMRQEGVQQRLHRGVGRPAVEQRATHSVDHVLVAQGI